MKRVISILFVILASVVAISACSKKEAEQQNQAAEAQPTSSQKPYLVYATKLQPTTALHITHSTAYLEPLLQTSTPFLQAGTVNAILRQEGEYVPAGTVIVVLANDTQYSSLISAKNDLDYSQKQYDRNRHLLDAHAISQNDYEVAEKNYMSSLAKYATASEDYNNTMVKTTIGGHIDKIYLKKGEYANKGSIAFDIVNDTGYQAVSNVAVGNALAIEQNSAVILTDGKNYYNATITNVAKSANMTSKTYRVIAKLEYTPTQYAGQTLELYFPKTRYVNVYKVPIRAMRPVGDKNYLYYIDSANNIQEKEVKPLDVVDGQLVFKDGFNEGDLISVEGQEFAKIGGKVSVTMIDLSLDKKDSYTPNPIVTFFDEQAKRMAAQQALAALQAAAGVINTTNSTKQTKQVSQSQQNQQ